MVDIQSTTMSSNQNQTQTIAVPEGFATPIKKHLSQAKKDAIAELSKNQEEWNSFLSPAQEEIFGSERHLTHPLLPAFEAYLEQLEHIKSCEEEVKVVWDTCTRNFVWWTCRGCGFKPVKNSEQHDLSKCDPNDENAWYCQSCPIPPDSEDEEEEEEEQDFCGYTECENIIPAYLDEDGILIDNCNEYCSEECRTLQAKAEHEDEDEEEEMICCDCGYKMSKSAFDAGKGRIMFDDLENGKFRCGVCDDRVSDPQGMFPDEE